MLLSFNIEITYLETEINNRHSYLYYLLVFVPLVFSSKQTMVVLPSSAIVSFKSTKRTSPGLKLRAVYSGYLCSITLLAEINSVGLTYVLPPH
jgi:hypothetical protein